MGHQYIPRQPVYAPSRRKASRVKEKLYLDQLHKKAMYCLSPLLRLRWSDILTFCPSTHPHDFLHLKLSHFFLSLFFLPPSCTLFHQIPDLFLRSILCILFINRIRNSIMDFESYFPLLFDLGCRNI